MKRASPAVKARVARRRWAQLCALGLAAAFVCGSIPTAGADDVRVTAGVQSRQVAMGETVNFTLTVEGAGMSGVSPTPPQNMVGLQVLGGPSSANQFSFVNGVISSSRSYTWVLGPTAVGKARIPATDVKIGSQIYRTEAIEIEVLPAGAPGQPQAQGGREEPAQPGRAIGTSELRIENELSGTRIYVGQPVIVTTRLLTTVPIMDVSAGPDPTVPGFLLEESDTNIVPERIFREGRNYQSYVLMRRILSPTQPGKTVIPSETRTVRIRLASRDVFNSFFAPRVSEVTRVTAPVAIEVIAPPAAGRPADFSGAVGQFKLEAAADREAASVGDAVGFKVNLTGSGNLKAVEGPHLAPTADFRIFDPRIDEKATGTHPRTYTKTWNYVITPLSSGSLGIPTVSFSYFDPAAEAYRTLTSPAVRIAVERGAPTNGSDSGALTAAGRREVQPLSRDIRFLKPLDGPLLRARVPLHRKGTIWAILGLAIVMQPAAWFLSRRGGLAALTPGGLRGRARRRAHAELVRAGSARRSDSVGPDGAAWRAVLGFIEERCGVVAEGRTYEEIDVDLARRGVSASTRGELLQFLESCDRGRFAPDGGARAVADILERARVLVDRLDREIGRAA